jgi:hypothetical protein
VEIEAIELGLARSARGGVPQVRLVAEAADAGAGTGAEGDTTLDRGADEASQDGRGLGERVGRRRVVGWLELAAGEEPHADDGEELSHVLVARWGRGVKGELPWPSLAEDTVEYERVQVDVELKATPEALEHRDRAGLAVLDACERAVRAKASSTRAYTPSTARHTA